MKLRRYAITGYTLALLIGVGLVFTYGAMEASSTPTFCGTCHVMEPYYDSWAVSSHADIACVDCHIPPGITAELRKKYEALSMVARYFTATYGTNPWAEVDDAACLECHERRLLAGGEVFNGILFDHRPHLTELRRGKRLRCTSCHSQIVQGSHITVTATTCTLCHFKDQVAGEGTAECTLCHRVPQDVVDAEGLRFDHSEVSRFGMNCLSCHQPPPADAGGVPRERCLTCHNDAERLERYGEGDFLHQTHVTDHKIECTNCHLEIDHSRSPHLEAARTECSACHGGRHAPQRDLYAGIGGKGVEPMPDVMFRAGVRCEGCHVDHGFGDETAGADEVACMSCHGPDYLGIYQGWKRVLGERVTAVERLATRTARAVSGPSQPLELAQANIDLVSGGGGIHNVPYSLALLATAHRQLNEARSQVGLASVAAPWPEAPYASPCLECHAGAESGEAKIFGRRFRHEPHVVSQGLVCESCHTTHEEREANALPALKLDRASCDGCHHSNASASNCESCHTTVRESTFPVAELGDFDHSLHVDDFELACTDCHGEPPGPASREVCTDCH